MRWADGVVLFSDCVTAALLTSYKHDEGSDLEKATRLDVLYSDLMRTFPSSPVVICLWS